MESAIWCKCLTECLSVNLEIRQLLKLAEKILFHRVISA